MEDKKMGTRTMVSQQDDPNQRRQMPAMMSAEGKSSYGHSIVQSWRGPAPDPKRYNASEQQPPKSGKKRPKE
jgi:hypothetical protein